MENIGWSFPRAKKIHICNLCGRNILPGEKYERQFNKEDGEVYTFKCCKECNLIYNEIYKYVDPWDDMDEDYYSEGIQNFCIEFICPNCPNWDKEDCQCLEDKWAWDKECFNKIVECLKENSLISNRNYYYLKKREQIKKLLGE